MLGLIQCQLIFTYLWKKETEARFYHVCVIKGECSTYSKYALSCKVAFFNFKRKHFLGSDKWIVFHPMIVDINLVLFFHKRNDCISNWREDNFNDCFEYII